MEQELQRTENGGREPAEAGIQVFNEVAWSGIEALRDGRKGVDFEHILELYVA